MRTDEALGTDHTLNSFHSLETGGANIALKPARALESLWALRPIATGGAWLALHALKSLNALGTGKTHCLWLRGLFHCAVHRRQRPIGPAQLRML